jgi:hypothetical protein
LGAWYGCEEEDEPGANRKFHFADSGSMNPRNTLRWLCVAAVLFAFLFFYQRHKQKRAGGPTAVFPGLQTAAVTRVRVKPLGQPEILAQRTEAGWLLVQPLRYAAQGTSIENLLLQLERLTPVAYITPRELKRRPKANEEYGFVAPQAIIGFEQPDYSGQLLVGTKTAPGDQIFLRSITGDGVYVVDADLLKSIPHSANDWRDTTLISLKGLVFDRISVTNGAKIFELRRDATNGLWRMVAPNPARADNARIRESLQKLHSARILQFVPETPKPELEALGLKPAEIEVALGQGTNLLALLQFGKTLTNDPAQIFGRRLDQNVIVTLPKELLEPWRAPPNDFRDAHLLAITTPIETIEVRAQDNFSLLRQTNNSWRILPENAPADPALVMELLSGLSGMDIVQFVKDVVTEPDLPGYGLASPRRKYILRAAPSATAAATNPPLAELHFGTNQEDRVYVRRTDESSVYAVKRSDVEKLPAWSWQLRDRQIWDVSENDVASITIRQQGKVRQILRKAQYEWSLAPGSQGSIEPLRTEETVRGLCHLAASAWVARGQTNRASYGFAEGGHQVTLEMKNGDKRTVEFGRESPSTFPYAAVTLEGDCWIFDFPLLLCRDVVSYLAIPAN